MKKLIFTVGLSGIGKSTRANKQEGYTVISKDKLRDENPSLKEDEIHKLQTKIALENDMVILDNTHLNKDKLNNEIKFYEDNGYDVEVKDFIKEELSKYSNDMAITDIFNNCIARNNNREKLKNHYGSKIPTSVIYEQALQYMGGYWYDNVHIFDIDGTLLDIEHRLKHIKQVPKDFKTFESEAEVLKDTIVYPVFNIARALKEAGYKIVLLTGRHNHLCDITEKQLNGLNYDMLIMKQPRDKRSGAEYKKEIYRRYFKGKVIAVVEDLKPVIDMRKEEGVFVLDCHQKDNVEY